MTANPIIEQLKENDIVIMEIPSTMRSDIKQICRIYDLKLENNWLQFKGEVLYTNIKLHESFLDEPLGNCTAITEIINPQQVEQIARVNDLWKADKYLLSDVELKAQQMEMIHDVMSTMAEAKSDKAQAPRILQQEDLENLGFKDDTLETADHIVTCGYYDGWNLLIEGKPGHSSDKISMVGFWTKREFIDLIKAITGKDFTL